jgi:hypothetical protein
MLRIITERGQEAPAREAIRGEIRAQFKRERSVVPMQKHREAGGIEQQLQFEARKQALQRWAESRASGGKRKTRPRS